MCNSTIKRVKVYGGPGCGKTTNEMSMYSTFLAKDSTPAAAEKTNVLEDFKNALCD